MLKHIHLPDAFIQSDLQFTVHSGYTFFYQYMCSLGIEPTTFALLRNALPLSHKNTYKIYVTKIHQQPCIVTAGDFQCCETTHSYCNKSQQTHKFNVVCSKYFIFHTPEVIINQDLTHLQLQFIGTQKKTDVHFLSSVFLL